MCVYSDTLKRESLSNWLALTSYPENIAYICKTFALETNWNQYIFKRIFGWVDLFYVTVDDISVIYVTMKMKSEPSLAVGAICIYTNQEWHVTPI